MKILIITLLFLCVYSLDFEHYHYQEPYCAFVNDENKEYIFTNRFYQFLDTNEYIPYTYKNTFQVYFYGNLSPWDSLQDEITFRTNVYEFKKKYEKYKQIKSLKHMNNIFYCDDL